MRASVCGHCVCVECLPYFSVSLPVFCVCVAATSLTAAVVVCMLTPLVLVGVDAAERDPPVRVIWGRRFLECCVD